MKSTKRVKVGYVIKGYLAFPVILGAILLALTVFLFWKFGNKAGFVSLGAFLVYIILAVIFIVLNVRSLSGSLLNFVREYETLEGKFIEQFPLPYVITDEKGNIIISNRFFDKYFNEVGADLNICDVFKDLKEADLDFDGRESEIAVVKDKRYYRLHITTIALPEHVTSEKIAVPAGIKVYVNAVVIFDETEIVNMMRSSLEEQVVIGNLYVDNYNEVIGQVEDVSRSLLNAMLDREILNYFTKVDGIVRKIERDRYFILFRKKNLAAMQRTKFDILDSIRAIDAGQDMPVTISMGVGVGETFRKSQDYAKSAVELALGRGGDQVVLKEGERTYFYGGKTKSVEKNTRVKARVTSLALREIIANKDHVVVMGHKIGDIDCLGASVGICKAANTLGKKAYIVLNELTNTIQPVLEGFLDDPDYGEDVFLSVNESLKYVDDNTALVIVDVNNPDIFEQPELIKRTKTIVIIDHHLQSDAKIDNVALSYIEPTASSASEMVTELLQYISGDIKLKKIEAEALYAGIMIDTNYFSKNTGVRTFEAAAFLKKNGVDIQKVKNFFNDTLDDFKVKAETIKNAVMISDGYAMAISPSEGIENPTIVAAQVANELLDLAGINASFVLLDYNGKIYISARSTGKVNVQLVMERMGGGGHMNSAGAQLEGDTIEEAVRKLKLTVNKMIEEEIL